MYILFDIYNMTSIKITQITELIQQDIIDVNLEIYTQLNSKVSLINKFTQHIFNNKGKQIRPIITILTAKALHYKKKQHIMIAALIEFIHTATLLHDDVIDLSCIRRGKKTANIAFGNAASILVGDFIYTRAFQMMTKLQSLPILSLIADAVNIIAEGELLQLTNCNNSTISIKKYMKIIYNKTARLFEISSQIPAILAGANSLQEQALRNYGRYIGIAFQLINDLSDYKSSDTTFEKNTGDDLNTGKPTLPLIHAIRHSTPRQASIIHQAIQKGNNRHLLNTILEILYQCGSLEYTHQCAKKKIKKAISYLHILPPSPYREALENLANLILQKCH